LIEWKQINQFGQSTFTDFTNPNFVKFAESMGLKGYRVESAADLIPILKTALEQEVPSVIDCPVDYHENLRLSERAGDLSCKM
jgi:acetolactate synthase-1/2/3 large subunit